MILWQNKKFIRENKNDWKTSENTKKLLEVFCLRLHDSSPGTTGGMPILS